jgi:hypothetical protein
MKKARGAVRPLVSQMLSQMLTNIRSVRPMSKQAQNKRPTVVVFGAFALALAGCSDSSSDPRDEIAIRPIPSFAATNALSQQLFAEAVTANPTSRSQLPVVGTATYRGAVSYVDSNISFVPKDQDFPEYETFLVNNPDYVSAVLMTADFASDSVSGSMNGLRNASEQFFRISIDFSGAIGNSSSNTAAFAGTLNGTNEGVNAEGQPETKSFNGTIVGNFLGARGESVLGTLEIDKGFTGDQKGDVFGVFTAEQ